MLKKASWKRQTLLWGEERRCRRVINDASPSDLFIFFDSGIKIDTIYLFLKPITSHQWLAGSSLPQRAL
jgi:hypothetical protein